MSRVKWFALALLVGSCVLTGCGPGTGTPPVSEGMGQAQVRQQEMSDAAYYNSIVVSFNIDDGDGYALCEGTTRVVGLEAGEQRRVKITSQMALNMSLCVRNVETGNYSGVQRLGQVRPGDWLEWSPSGFGITRYTGGE